LNADTQALMARIDSGWRPRPLPLDEDLRRCREIAEVSAERIAAGDWRLLMAAVAIKQREKRLLGMP